MCVCVHCVYLSSRAGPGHADRYSTSTALNKPAVGRVGTTLLVGMGGPVQDRPVHEQSVPGQLSPALKAAVCILFYHLELLSFRLRIKYTKN